MKRSARRKIQYRTGSALLDALEDDVVANNTATTSMASFDVDESVVTENVQSEVTMDVTEATQNTCTASESNGGDDNAERYRR